MKLQEECGVTKISLENSKLLKRLHGKVIAVTLWYTQNAPEMPCDYVTFARYADDTWHEFTGFAWGYSGKGPRGFHQWAEQNDVPLDMETICSLPNDRHYTKSVWQWENCMNTILYIVAVNRVPSRAFRAEHAAEHYIDHHETPNLCAIFEVPLIE